MQSQGLFDENTNLIDNIILVQFSNLIGHLSTQLFSKHESDEMDMLEHTKELLHELGPSGEACEASGAGEGCEGGDECESSGPGDVCEDGDAGDSSDACDDCDATMDTS